jgi:hypothetical protein
MPLAAGFGRPYLKSELLWAAAPRWLHGICAQSPASTGGLAGMTLSFE